jgi:hypothetical protein
MFDQFKTLFILLALASGLALTGCGGDDAAPAADQPEAAPADAAPADAAPADAAPADAAPADTAPADAAAADADPAAEDGMAERLKGEWGIALSGEDKTKLDEARKTLEANPEDPGAKMMVGMMDGMLAAMVLNVGDGSMTMGAGEHVKTIGFTMSDETATGCTLTTKEEGSDKEEKMTVSFSDDDVMTWTKEGEAKPLMWAKK